MDKEQFVEECVAKINKVNVMITERSLAENDPPSLNIALQCSEEAIEYLNQYLDEGE